MTFDHWIIVGLCALGILTNLRIGSAIKDIENIMLDVDALRRDINYIGKKVLPGFVSIIDRQKISLTK